MPGLEVAAGRGAGGFFQDALEGGQGDGVGQKIADREAGGKGLRDGHARLLGGMGLET